MGLDKVFVDELSTQSSELSAVKHSEYKRIRKMMPVRNVGCVQRNTFGDGGDPDVVECPEFTLPIEEVEPGVRIRYTSGDDLTGLGAFAIGGTAQVTDNGDGTYDLWSDDDCEFVSFFDDYYEDFYYGGYHIAITKVEVIKGSSLKYFIDLSSSISTFRQLMFTEFVWSDSAACTPTQTVGMFSGCPELLSLDLTFLDTSNVTDMSGMFYGCQSLTSLDLSNFNTSNVVDMYSMFDECNLLESIDVSNFNTSNVTDMSEMFSSCSLITSLDLTNFDTSNVTNMYAMFSESSALQCITNLDTTGAADTDLMFNDCTALLQPDATAQADLTASKGADWVNENACP